MRTLLLAGLLAFAPAWLGACAVDRKYSQTELDSIQTREYDAAYDRTFDAAIAALFDAGYVVSASDKRGGFVSAVRYGSGAVGGVQVKIDSVNAGRTTVRISTTDGGQARVDKKRVDEIAGLIGSRLLFTPPPRG